ncbi:hypothetical protein JCM5350_001270 [Sporobolomyces pararoseus]
MFAYYSSYGFLPGNVKALDLLVPRLHVIALDFCLINSLTTELLKKLDPITLFDAEIEDLEQAIPVSHLRVYDPFGYLEDYAGLIQRLSQAQLALPLTVYLPLSASPGPPGKIGDVSKRLELWECCTERGIEVIYEDIPDLWYLDSRSSVHFIEERRKERRKKEGKTRK